jgi:hypothetical protein
VPRGVPGNARLLAATRRELRRVAAAARTLYRPGPRESREARRTPASPAPRSRSTFGWDIARWLVERFPRTPTSIRSATMGCRCRSPGGVASRMEFELGASDARALEFLERRSAAIDERALAGSSTHSRACRAATRCAPRCSTRRGRSSSSARRSLLSRTFARGFPPDVLPSRAAAETRRSPALVDQPLPSPRRLSRSGRQQVVDIGRAVLAALGRETDAIALAYPEGVRWYDPRARYGHRALHDPPRRRGPLDSHIGMMLFKNGVPIGYGGGWPFLGDCRIGRQHLPAFSRRRIRAAVRTGAARLSPVLRRRALHCRAVAVRRDEREGLRSGAFWFYYG